MLPDFGSSRRSGSVSLVYVPETLLALNVNPSGWAVKCRCTNEMYSLTKPRSVRCEVATHQLNVARQIEPLSRLACHRAILGGLSNIGTKGYAGTSPGRPSWKVAQVTHGREALAVESQGGHTFVAWDFKVDV